MSTVDEVDRLRSELELDRNRFLLIKSLIAKGDVKGAAMTADVALNRLARSVGAELPPETTDRL